MATTGKSGSGMAWSDFWALFDVENEDERKILEEALSRNQDFYKWFKRRPLKHKKEVLEGAPLFVVVLLIHLLPQAEARKVAKNFPEEDCAKLSAAFFNPPQREDSTGEVAEQDLPRLPARDESGGHTLPVQKKVRRGT